MINSTTGTHRISKLYVASKNSKKARELQALLADTAYEVLPLPSDVPESPETGTTFMQNAIQKAQFYADHVEGDVIADDSGLEVPALGGEPGIYSARYAGVHGDDAANNAKLLARLNALELANPQAFFVCAVALCIRSADGEVTLQTAEGRVEGQLLSSPRGQAGFGYDPLFYVPALNRTYAELTMEEKSHDSHRARAIQALRKQYGW